MLQYISISNHEKNFNFSYLSVTDSRAGYTSSNSILNCNLVPFRVCITVKFCHEKMLTLYFPQNKPNHLNKIMFNPPPLPF